MKIPSLIAVAAVCGLIAAAQAQDSAPKKAAPAATGSGGSASKVSMCIGCHGIGGYKTAFPEVYSVPKLGGQHAPYILKALEEYKSGNRSHPSMRAIAAGLSEQDMKDVAAYYAQSEGK